MIYVIIGMSLLFVAIGFIVTENNAKYLLSGYNTMSEEDREKVDLYSYLHFFRRFHISLGVSLLILGIVFFFISEIAVGIFLGVYPISAYIYFLWNSTQYAKGLSTKGNKIGIYVLSGSLVFVIVIFVLGLKEDKLTIAENKIELHGSFGEEIHLEAIETVELVNHLPKITHRVNGFSLGTINKGFFKTNDGEVVKLIFNSDKKPYLLIIKTNGEKIYFSSKDTPNEEIYIKMREALPDISWK